MLGEGCGFFQDWLLFELPRLVIRVGWIAEKTRMAGSAFGFYDIYFFKN